VVKSKVFFSGNAGELNPRLDKVVLILHEHIDGKWGSYCRSGFLLFLLLPYEARGYSFKYTFIVNQFSDPDNDHFNLIIREYRC
jgi:hypothetical protein